MLRSGSRVLDQSLENQPAPVCPSVATFFRAFDLLAFDLLERFSDLIYT